MVMIPSSKLSEVIIMPIRLAQARLIQQDSYVPTHLRKSSCRPAPLLGRHEPPDTLQMAGSDRAHQGKMLNVQPSPRVI